MANRTDKQAHGIKGTNPQYLVEKIIRMRIYDSRFWKEECFALSAELIVDKGMELRYVGGVSGGSVKPTPFLCLTLKMLQIQPDKEIIIEFIRQDQYKYIRALGALYLRLTGNSVETYKYLEPLYNDYRKLRRMDKDGKFDLVHMDEYIDDLLRETTVCSIQLPRLQKRHFLEETNELERRVSALEEDLDNLSSPSSDSETEADKKRSARRKMASSKDRPSRGGSERDKERRRSRSRDRRPSALLPPPSSSSTDRHHHRRAASPPSSSRRRTDDKVSASVPSLAHVGGIVHRAAAASATRSAAGVDRATVVRPPSCPRRRRPPPTDTITDAPPHHHHRPGEGLMTRYLPLSPLLHTSVASSIARRQRARQGAPPESIARPSSVRPPAPAVVVLHRPTPSPTRRLTTIIVQEKD